MNNLPCVISHRRLLRTTPELCGANVAAASLKICVRHVIHARAIMPVLSQSIEEILRKRCQIDDTLNKKIPSVYGEIYIKVHAHGLFSESVV